MRPTRLTLTMDALDADGIAAAQQTAAASDLLINGALASGIDADGLVTAVTPAAAGTIAMDGALASSTTSTILSTPRRILVYATAVDESGDTYTITGTDVDGFKQTNTITGPDGTTLRYGYSTDAFATITDIYTSGAATGNLTFGVNGTVTMDVPRHVSIYCAGDMSAVTFTVYGLDRYGVEITEAITGPNATTVSGSKNFATVTRVACSAAVGTNVTVGTIGALDSQWIPVPRNIESITVGNIVSSGATLTYTTQYTLNDITASDFDESDADPYDAAGLTAEVASADGAIVSPVIAIRNAISGFTSGTLEMTVITSMES